MEAELIDPKDLRECVCCEEKDDLQFMKSMPEGYYCESCFAAIFE
jgi:hypothetical protein